MTILQDAAELINGDRAATYGDVTENFQRIADMWTAYSGVDRPFTAYDVSNMMILVKVARLATGGYHRDSVADIAGYAGLSEQINDAETVAEQPEKSFLEKLINSFWDAYSEPWATKPEPRVVEVLTFDDVFDSTVWMDRDGDFLKLEGDKWWRKYPAGNWFFSQDAEDLDYQLSYMATDYGPYTEVLEPA